MAGGSVHRLVRQRSLLLLVLLVALAVPACSRSGSSSPSTSTSGPPYAISSAVVSDPSTRDIRVWAPTEHRRWPVVYALPGVSGNKSDFDQLGPALARRGVVVFASDYRANGTLDQVLQDVVCGYRYVSSIAHRYGGDLTLPVTAVGYSDGARFIGIVKSPAYGPGGTYHSCLSAVAAPDVLVGINGCYFVYQGVPNSLRTPLGRPDAKVVLITGQADDVCRSWQSRKGAQGLKAQGFPTTVVSIPGANHYTPIFHDLVHGRWTTVAHDPAGAETTRTILHAIQSASAPGTAR